MKYLALRDPAVLEAFGRGWLSGFLIAAVYSLPALLALKVNIWFLGIYIIWVGLWIFVKGIISLPADLIGVHVGPREPVSDIDIDTVANGTIVGLATFGTLGVILFVII